MIIGKRVDVTHPAHPTMKLDFRSVQRLSAKINRANEVEVRVPAGTPLGMVDDLEAAMLHMNKRRRARGFNKIKYRIVMESPQSV